MSAGKNGAPLNIMVMTEGCEKHFDQLKTHLETCVGANQYSIYPLSTTSYSSPWQSSCKLVVIPAEVKATDWSVLDTYLNTGGRVVSFNSSWNHFRGFPYPMGISPDSLIQVKLCLDSTSSPFYATSISNESATSTEGATGECKVLAEAILNKEDPVTMAISADGAGIMCYMDLISHNVQCDDMKLLENDAPQRRDALRQLLRTLDINCSDQPPPPLSLCYLLASDKNLVEQFLQKAVTSGSLRNDVIIGRENKVEILLRDGRGGLPVDITPTHNHTYLLPHPTKGELTGLPFNVNEYLSHLQTKTLGRTVIYSPVISSTQTLFTGNIPFAESFSEELGTIAIASQQMRGKGRTGNTWISPPGCLMFTLLLKLKSQSRLANRITILQHLVALSFVDGVRSLKGYEELDLRIKWPNDIYYGSKEKAKKIGGILITTHAMGNIVTAAVGCGVNINNASPTVSLNSCIEMYNKETSSTLQPFSLEPLLAITMKKMEDILREYKNNELDKLLPLYYHYWLHSSAMVQVEGKEATIIGIDDYGYLRVQSSDHKITTLHPDGNSFDLMKGLIKQKSRS